MQKNWDEYSKAERQQVMIASAYEQTHRSSIVVDHQRFRKDCSGFVQAILWGMGHDIVEFTKSYGIHTNGVGQIYEYITRLGTIYEKKSPQPGDIVFFSNTYDLNRDGRNGNDELTHIGIITSVDRDETISFLHVVQKEVQKDFMNLARPNIHEQNGKVINSYLKRFRKNDDSGTLTSQLFDFFGSLNP